MAEYTELFFRSKAFGDDPIWPDIARKMLAEALDGEKISPVFFHRDHKGSIQGRIGDDRNGEGMGLPPSVIFDGGRGFVRLYGVGQEGVETLALSLPTVLSALNRHLGSPVLLEMRQGSLDIKATGYGVLHSIHRLVVSKKSGFPDDDYQEKMKREIVRGLVSCARIHAPHFESLIPSESEIEVLEGVPCAVEIKPGIMAGAVKNVVVAMPIRLSGPWSVGRLRSRGYGLIRSVTPRGPRTEVV